MLTSRNIYLRTIPVSGGLFAALSRSGRRDRGCGGGFLRHRDAGRRKRQTLSLFVGPISRRRVEHVTTRSRRPPLLSCSPGPSPTSASLGAPSSLAACDASLPLVALRECWRAASRPPPTALVAGVVAPLPWRPTGADTSSSSLAALVPRPPARAHRGSEPVRVERPSRRMRRRPPIWACCRLPGALVVLPSATGSASSWGLRGRARARHPVLLTDPSSRPGSTGIARRREPRPAPGARTSAYERRLTPLVVRLPSCGKSGIDLDGRRETGCWSSPSSSCRVAVLRRGRRRLSRSRHLSSPSIFAR